MLDECHCLGTFYENMELGEGIFRVSVVGWTFFIGGWRWLEVYFGWAGLDGQFLWVGGVFLGGWGWMDIFAAGWGWVEIGGGI